MTKNAVIIDNINDVSHLSVYFEANDSLFLTDRYPIYSELGPENIHYFFGPSEDGSKDLKKFYDFGDQWYRDDEGRDLTFVNGISIGQILSRRIMFMMANDYRNYVALKNLASRCEIIHASTAQSNSFKRVASLFSEKMRWYAPISQSKSPYISSPERAVPHDALREHRFSRFVRKIQRLIPFILNKRKILHMSDWTSFGLAQKRRDLILTYTYQFWKGAYFLLEKEFLEEADRIFPQKLPDIVFSIPHLKLLAERICAPWDEDFIGLVSNSIENEYEASRGFYLKTYAFYKEMFVNYRPHLITFPGENHFAFVIGMQIAKAMGIPTMLIVDGYTSYNDPSLIYWDKEQKDLLVNYFAAFGKAHHDVTIESGIPAERCVLMKPTVLHKYDHVSRQCKENQIYDALIMDYSPHLINPYARWDMRSKIVADILKILLELGLKHIAIKTKPYFSRENELEALLRTFDKKSVKVEIVTGQLFEHLPKAKCVVGQISTAVLETSYLGIPYYVYEPVENGKPDYLIKTSKILNRNTIARTEEELKVLIKSGKSSISSDRDYLFAGPSFETVELPINRTFNKQILGKTCQATGA